MFQLKFNGVSKLLQGLLSNNFGEIQEEVKKPRKPTPVMETSTDGTIKVHNQGVGTRQVKRALKRASERFDKATGLRVNKRNK